MSTDKTQIKQIELGDIYVDIIFKDIKNVHLSVNPPKGRVRISAPLRMDMDLIRNFAITKIHWINKQRIKFNKQKRETPREYVTRESHYFFGKRYLLKVIEQAAPPKIVLKHSTIELYIRDKNDIRQKQTALQEWYRQQLKIIAQKYILEFGKKIGVTLNGFGVKKMKTRWGTCNQNSKMILINLDLAKKPAECIEYVVIHELIHLTERKHNENFIRLLTKFCPKWRKIKEELNELALSCEKWDY